MKFIAFGTGPASGWPSYGQITQKRRRPSTYAISCKSTNLLLDAGSVEAVMDAVIKLKKIDAVLLSHAHNDHWAGLNNLRWGPPTPVYLSEETLNHPYFKEIADKPFSLQLRTVEPFTSFEVGNAKVTPFPLNHIEGTLGYLVECGNVRLAYALDTKWLPEESIDFLRGKVDYLVVDSALPIGETGLHNTYEEALLLGKELGAKVFAVHLLPSVTEREVVEKGKELGVSVIIPEDNQEFDLSQ